MSAAGSEYVSIFLQPLWVHEAYYGWSMPAWEAGRLKLLRKRRAGIWQHLLLARGVGEEELAGLVTRHRLLGPASITTLHDFDARSEPSRTLLGRPLRLLDSDERMLNVATYVMDLAANQDELWERLGSKSRNMVRRAEGAGTQVPITREPEALAGFFPWHAALAAKHRLRHADEPAIRRMCRDGRLLVAACKAQDNSLLTVNLIYLSGAFAYFLFGASAEELPPGCGQLVHWQTALHLKQAGCRWSDLGGVPPSPADGIHRFKASLGGSFCDLGREYRYTPAALAGAYRWLRKLRR